jgi:hypothetical protein
MIADQFFRKSCRIINAHDLIGTETTIGHYSVALCQGCLIKLIKGQRLNPLLACSRLDNNPLVL